MIVKLSLSAHNTRSIHILLHTHTHSLHYTLMAYCDKKHVHVSYILFMHMRAVVRKRRTDKRITVTLFLHKFHHVHNNTNICANWWLRAGCSMAYLTHSKKVNGCARRRRADQSQKPLLMNFRFGMRDHMGFIV